MTGVFVYILNTADRTVSLIVKVFNATYQASTNRSNASNPVKQNTDMIGSRWSVRNVTSSCSSALGHCQSPMDGCHAPFVLIDNKAVSSRFCVQNPTPIYVHKAEMRVYINKLSFQSFIHDSSIF